MKSKRSCRIKWYDINVMIKKSTFIITRSDSTGLSKLSWQTKGKTTKNTRQSTENELTLFADFLADQENFFVTSFKKLVLKKSASKEVFKHIKSTFEKKWIPIFSNRLMLRK